jgi:NAD(P)-dependent dehydrogenase (short-subunit alcohol dehydrogenase family)
MSSSVIGPGSTAVVTGGGSGIGKALAERFGAAGMNIVVADIDEAAAARTAAGLASAVAVGVDVRSQPDLDRLLGVTFAEYGIPDIVCANAGVGSRGLPSVELPAADFDWVLGVNLHGAIRTVQTFLPSLVRAGAGRIVTTASVAGLAPMRLMAPYSAAKAGLIAYSEVLRDELDASGVGVSVLCPSWVRTSLPDWERHDPYHHQWSVGQRQALHARRSAVAAAFQDEGIEPSELAEIVVRAIEHDRFWILTSTEVLADLERRTESIRSDLRPRPTTAG